MPMSAEAIQPEFHRPLPLDRIGPSGHEAEVKASDAECAALAGRLLLPAVLHLSCRFRLHAHPAGRVAAAGHLKALLVRTCVITLDDFEVEIDEPFSVSFVPEGTESDDPDPESEDEIPYCGSTIDLGEAATEQLALALDPYPRKPGAELPEAANDVEDSPFARLATLRPKN
jgi:uncharacterized metal-binding protein YceD (DUF177 family)